MENGDSCAAETVPLCNLINLKIKYGCGIKIHKKRF